MNARTRTLSTLLERRGYANRKNGRAYLQSSHDPNCFDNLSVMP